MFPRPVSTLTREIIAVLLLKACFLWVIWWLFFSHGEKVDAQVISKAWHLSDSGCKDTGDHHGC